MNVVIKRHPKDYMQDEVDLDGIYNIHWDHVSGGTHTQTSNYFLMGYIQYRSDLNVRCSGQHDYSKSGIKVCIIQKHTPKETWNYLMDHYGKDKPATNRKLFHGHCAPEILKILESGPKSREELYKSMQFERPTFRRALKSLSDEGEIKLTGSNHQRNQIIEKVK